MAQSPHWLQWMPHIYPKITPSPSTIYAPIYHTNPLTESTHNYTWHPDPISRFLTIHPPDRKTDQQTDQQMG